MPLSDGFPTAEKPDILQFVAICLIQDSLIKRVAMLSSN